MDRQSHVVLLLLLLCAWARAQEDPYQRYIRTAPEFRSVRRVEATRWKTWLYMPWRYRWTVGTEDEGGRFCRDHHINGGVVNGVDSESLPWLEKWKLGFYVDHLAGKGTLHLFQEDWKPIQRDPRQLRPMPLNAKQLAAGRKLVTTRVKLYRQSPMRVAYALDDEVSWSTFLRPLPWRVDGDEAAYRAWLETYYGRPHPAFYVAPEFTRKQLGRPLKAIDFSPLLDRMSYNDSVLANFVGALVDTANELDPETPCGIVGGQSPNLWGGYDYAKFLKKVQFLEVYDQGSAPEIVRSLSDVPLVSTHFHGKDPSDNSWLAWNRFAHGQRGMIAWVGDGWFEGQWLKKFASVLEELGQEQGPKMAGARWQGDGIALYYSHPSIQVSWCLDMEPHGKTWPNRLSDALLGTSHTVRKAWEFLLNDAGLQYDFCAYDEVVRNGVPAGTKVLILPACFALSDAEADRIRAFARRGGTVIADFMCGLFDQHGKGRSTGALDDLFGVRHDGNETKADFFSGKLWVETDQDKGYEAQHWRDLLLTLGAPMRDGFTVAERRLKGPYVNGKAVYLNLSPLRYLLLREERRAAPRHLRTFLKHVGVRPAVTVTGDDHLEVLRWSKGERTLLFVVQNPVLRANGTRALMRAVTYLDVRFRRPVRDVVNERTGKSLGDGDRFRIEFRRAEAVFLSFTR